MSVLEGEIAQAPEMVAAMDAYHATDSKAFKKPLRVVYFCPKDVEPFDDYQARTERIMLDFQLFFEKEMAGGKNRSYGVFRIIDKYNEIKHIKTNYKSIIWESHKGVVHHKL